MGVRTDRLRRRKARRAIAGASVALSVLGAGVVTVVVGNVTGPSGLLAAAESQAGLEVSAGAPRGQATVLRIADLRLADYQQQGQLDVGVWVAKGVSERLLSVLNAPTEGYTSVVTPDGLSLRAIVPTSVVLRGKVHDVLTNAATVRELLSAMGIEPDWNDRVSSPLRAPISRAGQIQVVNVRVMTEETVVTLPHGTQTTYSEELPPGEVNVLREGVPGQAVRTYRVRLEDGKVVSRRLVEEAVVSPPVTERRVMGIGDVEDPTHVQVGEASWYWHDGLTAAHPWLPFGTRVTVTNLANGKSVVVVINDRGPFGGRIIDLSDEAFAVIAPLSQGVCQVRLTW
jgi:hypothetical protein